MNFLNKFKYAFEGINYLLKKDKNFQIHFVLLTVLICFGFLFNISKSEWISVLICSAFVLCLEAINSSIENLADVISKEIHPDIKIVKDISAAAVLIAACISCVIALVIFIPKICSFLNF